MTQFDAFKKKLPESLPLLGPMLVISIGLHVLFLLLPIGDRESLSGTDSGKNDLIKITQLPPAPRSGSASPSVATVPNSAETPPVGTVVPTMTPPDSGTTDTSSSDTSEAGSSDTSSSDTSSSDTSTSDTGSSDTTSSDTTSSDTDGSDTSASDTGSSDTGKGSGLTGTTSAKKPETTPSSTKPTQTAQGTEAGGETTQSSSPGDSQSPTTPPAIKPILNPEPQVLPQMAAKLKQLRARIPNYPTAQIGCAGLPSCYTLNKDIEKVAAFFKQELEIRGYGVVSEVDQADRKVYRFSKDDESRVLTLLTNGNQTTYVVSSDPRSPEDLQQAEKIFADYQSTLTKETQEDGDSKPNPQRLAVKPDDFQKPELFYRGIKDLGIPEAAKGSVLPESRAATSGNFWLVRSQTPTQVFSRLESKLKEREFGIKALKSSYGGGPVYELTRKQSKFYLNLVPTKDNQSTIVVTWFASPLLGDAGRHERYVMLSESDL